MLERLRFPFKAAPLLVDMDQVETRKACGGQEAGCQLLRKTGLLCHLTGGVRAFWAAWPTHLSPPNPYAHPHEEAARSVLCQDERTHFDAVQRDIAALKRGAHAGAKAVDEIHAEE